jgi:hypothetical protein
MLAAPVRSRVGEEDWMRMTFRFRLVLSDGSPADPPEFQTMELRWSQGDVIPLGERSLRVLGVRDHDADQPTVLVVEDLPSQATSDAA